MKVKTSYGITLCRYNKDNHVEVLLIKKRYSYQYLSFIMGHYKKSDIDYLKYLFNNMSYAEKIDIIGMQYSQMWYRIWLNNPEKNSNITNVYRNNNFSNVPITNRYSDADIRKIYFERKHRFENNFTKDSGKKLIALIQQSSDSEILWEAPKGGKNPINLKEPQNQKEPQNPKEETNIDCAVREFYEETSISDNKYKILYDVNPLIDSYIDNDINYKTVYYIAMLNPAMGNFKPHIDFKNFDQIVEVEQIKWVSLAEVKFFTLSPSIHNRLIKLYTSIIAILRKHRKLKKLHL